MQFNKNLTVLNTREIKTIREKLIEQFGYFLEEDYAYFVTEKSRVFLVNKDIGKINQKNLIIDRVGLYFAELMDDSSVRLSKEGSQLLWEEVQKKNEKGKEKKLKNVVELSKEEVKKYFTGADLEKDLGTKAKFVLLHFENDVLGCAKYKEGKILNFLPKIHRGEVII